MAKRNHEGGAGGPSKVSDQAAHQRRGVNAISFTKPIGHCGRSYDTPVGLGDVGDDFVEIPSRGPLTEGAPSGSPV
jgi:hypothetical protein